MVNIPNYYLQYTDSFFLLNSFNNFWRTSCRLRSSVSLVGRIPAGIYRKYFREKRNLRKTLDACFKIACKHWNIVKKGITEIPSNDFLYMMLRLMQLYPLQRRGTNPVQNLNIRPWALLRFGTWIYQGKVFVPFRWKWFNTNYHYHCLNLKRHSSIGWSVFDESLRNERTDWDTRPVSSVHSLSASIIRLWRRRESKLRRWT